MKILLCLPIALVLFCALSHENFTREECAQLKATPDSCIVDTLGIIGTIFPKGYSGGRASGNTNEEGPAGTWTPSKEEVLLAEKIFQAEAPKRNRCLDSNAARFYRQYAGRGHGNMILIHGIRKSHDVTFCGCRSFWINIYEEGCSVFDAEVNLQTGACYVQVKESE